jgi:hypothetical protein
LVINHASYVKVLEGAFGVASTSPLETGAAAARVATALAMLDTALACPYTEAKANWLKVLQVASEPLEKLTTDLKE